MKQLGYRAVLIFAFSVAVVGGGYFLTALDDRMALRVQSGAVENKPVIVLDAGHGGMDAGAVSGGIRESEINLAIAEKARKMLTLLGYRVVMTRETDTLLADENAKTVRQQKRSDLENRLKIMAGTPGAVGVSIHQNHFSQSYVHGAQVFYGKAEGSERLAELIQKNIAHDRTYTEIHPLDTEGRVQALARLISGDHVTELSLANAREMLSNSAK